MSWWLRRPLIGCDILRGYLRERPSLLLSELPLLTFVCVLSQLSRRAVPGPTPDHGGHLTLEPRTAEHEAAVGTSAQALQ
jgi:hypothetical protein